MDEASWLSSADPVAMLAHVQDKLSSRQLRLFACACCRAVWDGEACERCSGRGSFDGGEEHEDIAGLIVECPDCQGRRRTGGLTDPRSRRSVEVAERYADGEATDKELALAHHEAWAADRYSEGSIGWTPIAGNAAGWCAQPGHESALVDNVIRWLRSGLSPLQTPTAQAALLREVVGNPWRRSSPCGKPADPVLSAEGHCDYYCENCAHILTWNGGTVPRLAQAIYDERAWDRMPILADALEDAGCTDVELLAHCRGAERCWLCMRCESGPGDACSVCGSVTGPNPHATRWIPLRGPHVRGCHVLDLLLGKT